jgi:hypothetical protein
MGDLLQRFLLRHYLFIFCDYVTTNNTYTIVFWSSNVR